MAAEIKNGRDTNRIPLHEVAPRRVPFAIGLSPSDICNFRCNYCNQSTEVGIREAQIVTWEDFLNQMEQIEELVELGKDVGHDLKILRFIGNGEPLINKRLPDMIKYCKDKGLAERLEITTNGSLLSPEVSDKLIDAGLTRLLISVQGTTVESYKKVCGFNLNMDRFLENITYFYNKSRGKCTLYIKTVDTALVDKEDRKRFLDMFSPICDFIDIEQTIAACADVEYENITDRDINSQTRFGEKVVKKICCDTLFMYLNIHSNGDVDCCGCKYPPLFIGNCYKNRLVDIWNGKVHKAVMMKHLEGKRCEIEDCRDCASIEHYNGFEEDNLDNFREKVLERVRKL